MRHHHCTEYEPLLKGSTPTTIRQIATKKQISESIHREQSILGSKFRSENRTRWYIIFSISICWLSTYFNCIYSPYIYNGYDDEEYLLSITYILSVFTPLFIPRILLFFNGSSLITLISIQFISLCGEILFYFGLQQSFNIILMYMGRIFIGISLGLNGSVIISILIFWFQKSSNLSLSSTFICVGVILSIVFSHLLYFTLNNYTNGESGDNPNLFISLIPILINFVSIWLLFVVNCVKNKNIPPIYDQMILRDFYNNGNILKKLKQISNCLWLIILNLSLSLALINVLYTIFIPGVLTQVYQFNDKETFIMLMLSLCFFVLWSLPISYIVDHYGYYIQFNMLSTFLFFISMLFLFFGGNSNYYHHDDSAAGDSKAYSIVSLIILAISTLFISSHFSLTILSTKPIELSPYVASIIVILYWFFTVVFNDIITWLNQQIISKYAVTYLDSILFILFLSFLQFLISAITYGITVKSKLNLHHPTPNKIEY